MDIRSFQEYKEVYQKSIQNPEEFWASVAENYQWYQKWHTVLRYDFHKPEIAWFEGAKLNITVNCLDRHLPTRANQTALIWESNFIDEPFQKYTYQELYHKVNQIANALRSIGVKKGDRVCLYMPMIPELLMSVLACARIGAIHSVVFAGFSAQSLAGRIQDCGASVVITADELYRGDKIVPLKKIVDEALTQCTTVQKVLIYPRTKAQIPIDAQRDILWNDLVPNQSTTCEPEIMDAEDPLFILYTSGSTGKPKGLLHTQAGYMVYVGYSFKNVFQYQENEVFFCTADIGWITGHSYLTYGPLLNGAITLMFEGIPTYPTPSRFWDIIQKHKVNIFYTAPTAIRALEALGTEWLQGKDLSSLRVLGSVGEPINEEAWEWYYKNVGKEKCPIVDTWWQTETGGILISPLAGITPLKPSYATLPLPGVQPVIVDDKGNILEGNNIEGNLCIRFPVPSMARTTYGNHEIYAKNYFSTYPGLYFTGDGAKRDEKGYYRITGRVDDVINVSGHRIGTGEVESAINEHPDIVESAVVGYPHEIKGQGIYAYVVNINPNKNHEELKREIVDLVSKQIGPIAKPDKIQVVSGLPKTRSGKIMRRILRKIAEGDTSNLGDTSTLLDPSVVEEIKKNALL
ncbi:MAG: acetate--CoA ligase [Bacteroidia bacterium]|nr:acetate--CoA ligase [Bacteroidia bacterium]MDW8303056.1 acetate--CoA ligase [Bacteroidia bacterium]